MFSVEGKEGGGEIMEPKLYCAACGRQMKQYPDCDEFDRLTGERRFLNYTCEGSSRSGHDNLLKYDVKKKQIRK